jgi:hypothetical protein
MRLSIVLIVRSDTFSKTRTLYLFKRIKRIGPSQLSLRPVKVRAIYNALQRQNAENWKQIFPEKEYRGLSPNSYIHVSVSVLYIPTMGLPHRPRIPSPPPLSVAKTGRNHLNEKFTPLLPTGIGERF